MACAGDVALARIIGPVRVDAVDPSVLEELESEAIWALRETAAAFARPVLLYSIGKDSTVLLHLARKAFHPGPIPFPVKIGRAHV